MKPKTSRKTTHARVKTSWSEAMKQALRDKPAGSRGPEQPKPRDSGKPRVKKDSF